MSTTHFIDKIQASTIIKTSIFLLFFIFPSIILFTWQETFSIEKTIEHTKFGTFGDFFGGTTGTILQFLGVLLFYIALKEQRKDFDTNRQVFEKQVEALNLQINEFSLQRTELEETRKVFTEQSKTLKQQRFETTFFSLIDLYHKIISNLNNQQESRNYFKKLKTDLFQNFNFRHAPPSSQYTDALETYTKSFYTNKEELTNYFRIIYRILSTIDNADLTKQEKKTYVKIIRSQLSENELLLLYYNAATKYGTKLYPIILEYNLLKHLPSLSKLEFKNYITSRANISDLQFFNSFLYDALKRYISSIDTNVQNGIFETIQTSLPLYCNKNIILGLKSEDSNLLELSLIFENNVMEIFEFNITEFQEYLQSLLADLLIYSRYNEPNKINITPNSKIGNKICLKIESEIKIALNVD